MGLIDFEGSDISRGEKWTMVPICGVSGHVENRNECRVPVFSRGILQGAPLAMSAGRWLVPRVGSSKEDGRPQFVGCFEHRNQKKEQAHPRTTDRRFRGVSDQRFSEFRRQHFF